ncbi:MAG TPA: polysaccharide pyruvyl transferase family protein [Rhizobiales bacterium]|nr:polysaccharide pyruvyl transferase family protein [Hyphomicrobiales bacterium]
MSEAQNAIRITARPLRLTYFVRIPNVGDLVNPPLVTALSGVPTVHSRGAGGHLLAIGSMMHSATPASHVWGTGVMHPDLGVGRVVADRIHALRGKRSFAALRGAGVAVPDVPLGDPGFLAPKLLGVRRSARPTHRLGIVPHYTDAQHPAFRTLGYRRGVRVLDVHRDPLRFLHEMAECAAVVSSSLHGLVFAEALGIPNLWVTAGDEIAGGTFKYEDWFSTMRRPQAGAVALTEGMEVEDLAARASLHDSTIDEAALADAFPAARMEEFREPRARRIIPAAVCRTQPVPVFLVSAGRGETLRRAVGSIRRLATPTQVVVVDGGSEATGAPVGPPGQEGDGATVGNGRGADTDGETDAVREAVARFFADWAEPQRYVVGDCDTDLSIARPDTLEVYGELLNRFRAAEAVGPMLRIADVPRSHPHFAPIMNGQIEQFWSRQPTTVATSWGVVACQNAAIGPAFALHRAGEPFRKTKEGLRTYEPFEARRLDWHAAAIGEVPSATGNAPSPGSGVEGQGDVLRFETYLAVERDEAGVLHTRRRAVVDNPE